MYLPSPFDLRLSLVTPCFACHPPPYSPASLRLCPLVPPSLACVVPLPVAIIGVGLVGKEVVAQLATLAESFTVVSLTNSRYTAASPTLGGAKLLSLLPPSSASALPASPAGVTLSPANVESIIAALVPSKGLLIDCTSDLRVTEFYASALSQGVSVATPNKKGVSSDESLWQAIYKAQAGPDAGLLYIESTVGAGLPIISTLRDLIATGDTINKIEGVFSGTLSYIFNEFSPAKPAGDLPAFSAVVKIAKDNGYTEPHPADDLSGSDVARKLTILNRVARSALSLPKGFASLPTESLIPAELEGIATGDEFMARLPSFDAHFDALRAEAAKDGKVLRYVGVIDAASGEVKCSLEKYAVSHPFASALSGSDNIVAFHTKRYPSPLIVQGAGAGAAVTAMGVVADAIKIAERRGVITKSF